MQGVSRAYGLLWGQSVSGGIESTPREVVYNSFNYVPLGYDSDRGEPKIVGVGDL